MVAKTVQMALAKETKGTFVYEVVEEVAGEPLPVVRSVYVAKGAMPKEAPLTIRLTVEWA